MRCLRKCPPARTAAPTATALWLPLIRNCRRRWTVEKERAASGQREARELRLWHQGRMRGPRTGRCRLAIMRWLSVRGKRGAALGEGGCRDFFWLEGDEARKRKVWNTAGSPLRAKALLNRWPCATDQNDCIQGSRTHVRWQSSGKGQLPVSA